MPNNKPVKTIKDTELRTDKVILVRGNVEYSHLTTLIDGPALEADKKRKQQAGMIPIDKPYTTVTLTNARIVPLDDNGPTIEERFVQEHFYQKKDDTAPHYQVINKSKFPPRIYRAKPGKLTEGDQIHPTAEMARGMDVILVMQVFESGGNYGHKSVGLQAVILQEDIRYYVGGVNKVLAENGIILRSTPAPEGQPNTTANATATAPAAEAAPVAQPTSWTCPNCGNENPSTQRFCGGCGTPQDRPAGGNNPYVAQAQNNQNRQGVRYDPNDRHY